MVARVREKTMAKVVCESRLSGQTQPATENMASTVEARNKARKLMESSPHFATHTKVHTKVQKHQQKT